MFTAVPIGVSTEVTGALPNEEAAAGGSGIGVCYKILLSAEHNNEIYIYEMCVCVCVCVCVCMVDCILLLKYGREYMYTLPVSI